MCVCVCGMCICTCQYKKIIPVTFLAVPPILCCFLFLWKHLWKICFCTFPWYCFPTPFYCKKQLSLQKKKKKSIVFLLFKEMRKKILQNLLKNFSEFGGKKIPCIWLASTVWLILVNSIIWYADCFSAHLIRKDFKMHFLKWRLQLFITTLRDFLDV